MNILVTINNQYVRPLLIMLASLFSNEAEEISIYLLYSCVSENNIALLKFYVEKWGGKFISVPVNEDLFQDVPLTARFENTREIYYRLLCCEVLPKMLDRILYLDPDIIVRHSIRTFYEMDFRGKMLAGIVDLPMFEILGEEGYRKRKKELGLTDKDAYINSGVLLMNLEEMREKFCLKDFLLQAERLGDFLKYPDQDMINLVFKKEIAIADKNYNYPAGFCYITDALKWALKGMFADDPSIVHYMGDPKPWEFCYIGRYYFEYRKYCRIVESRREWLLFEWKHFWGSIWWGGIMSLKVLFRAMRRFFGKTK